MSDQSPLFFHAIELLIHSMELFQQANERTYPFIALHLANAVELLLHDRLIDAGHSLNDSVKGTPLPFNKALDLLKKERVKLPERPFLELLNEDRQTLQHRFERPELRTVYRYLDETTEFARRFLHDEYGVELADTLFEFGLKEEEIHLFGVLEGQGNVLAFLNKLFDISPESAILQAFNFVEARFAELSFLQAAYLDPHANKSFLRSSQRSAEFTQLLDKLVEEQFFTAKMIDEMDALRFARNYAVFASPNAQPPDWKQALAVAQQMIIALDAAIERKYAAGAAKEPILEETADVD